MGFGNKKEKEKSVKDKVREAEKENTQKFVPTTKEEWKRISKRARKHDEERDERRARKKEKGKKRLPKTIDHARNALTTGGYQDDEIKIYRQNFFEALVKMLKDRDLKVPQYHAFEENRRVRDGRFIYDMNYALSRLSWWEHSQLIATATDLPIPTRDWSEAWHMVQSIIHRCFKIKTTYLGNQLIKDLEALEDWPMPFKKRKVDLTTEEKVSKNAVLDNDHREKRLGKRIKDGKTLDMFDEDEKKRLKMRAREDDDEEEDEEEDDRDDEEDEDEEDEKPRKKGKKSRKKARDSDDEDDDGDDGDEEDDSDDDEDDEDDGDDDDDGEKSSKRKSKKERKRVAVKDKASKKADKKAAKAEKKDKSEKPARGDDVTYKVTKKFKGGVKEEVQAVIKSSGSTFDQIASAAKKAGIDKGKDKIRAYLNWLAANGYVKKVA